MEFNTTHVNREAMMPSRVVRWSVVLTGLFLCWGVQVGRLSDGYAQELVQGHSTDLIDAKALFRNPALVSFQRPKFFAGAKAYYLGLGDASGVPLRQGFFAASTPFLYEDRLGIAAGGQYFSSPIFRRSRFGIRVSGRIDIFSLGIELDALTTGYNASNFSEDALSDPLFDQGTSKTSLAIGAGAYVQPALGLGLSLGVRNLNRPVTSLEGNQVRAEVEVYSGVTYAYGPMRASLELNRREIVGTTALLSVEVYSTAGHYARATSDLGFAQARIEGQYYVGGPLSINYSYDLPTSELLGPSSGSHQFTLIYEFGRSPSVGPPPVVPPTSIPFGMNDPDAELLPMVYVTTEADYVEVYEKRIKRRFDPNLSEQAIASLSWADIELADSSFNAYTLPFKVDPIRPISEDVRFPTPISSNYESSLARIGTQLAGDAVEGLSIVGRDSLVEKVMGIRNRVVLEEGAPRDRVEIGTPLFASNADSVLFNTALTRQDIVPQEVIEYATPGATVFYLYPFQVDASDLQQWSLVIVDQQDREVQRFSGVGTLPEQIAWDWRANTGGYVEPGTYQYQVFWQERGAEMRQSMRNRMYVKKFVRQVTIDIRQDLNGVDATPDKVQLLIKN